MNVVNAISLNLQRRFGRQRLRRILLGAIPFIALLGLWQANAFFGWLEPVYIPPLTTVWESIFILQADCPGLIGG